MGGITGALIVPYLVPATWFATCTFASLACLCIGCRQLHNWCFGETEAGLQRLREVEEEESEEATLHGDH